MFEKVNPSHPDKIADRIAGAMVDYAYKQEKNPKIAVEVLIGHGKCLIIAETSVHFTSPVVNEIVERITQTETIDVEYVEVKQDEHLAKNQNDRIRCGDNGIFKGTPVTDEQRALTKLARSIYNEYKSDGKYIINEGRLTICQSKAEESELREMCGDDAIINPLGYWTGGTYTDSGATNRKLGSDMGDSVTGGGLHGKDLSKADVSVNIYAWLTAQEAGHDVNMCCSIGDEAIDGADYEGIVAVARDYIDRIGGFEKFAEWGLIR